MKGVLKDRKQREKVGKDPRPIAIATLKNRVVQRAILQVLQPRKASDERDINTKFEPIEGPRLGTINQVNRSRFGVGGLMRPFGGVRPAIKLIMDAMTNGGDYYYQSDIKAFFTKIPTAGIVTKVRSETGDEKLAALFAKGLEVNLANEDELFSYSKLFPSNGTGVAQGSSLSAFAGNVLLFDFDHQLNDMGVTAVRYIDDLLIVSSSETSLDDAISFSEKYLASFGFSLYPAVAGSDKAARGKCKTGFNFLGCMVQTNRCVPSSASRKKVSADVSEAISASRKAINELVQQGKQFNPKHSRSTVIHTLGKKLFGWEKSFAFCTDAQAFKLVDADVAAKVIDYEQWVQRKIKGLSPDMIMLILGIPITEQLFHADIAKRKAS
ncbi:reverse transcriptase domain-containing protein [Agrobacterium sp. ES01]|uniref:reverse transcriptase domain-containing protein n=1 Tax=Agrobacterium sp. ES01 TaxID=3420714 RepID=UPI003D0E5824